MKLKLFFIALLLASAGFIGATVKMPKVFTSNMILQRDIDIPVWGHSKPGEKVTVVFKNQKISTSASKGGEWVVRLKPEPAGGPFTMTIKGQNEIILDNILIGDVWICSGQSNMEWPLWNTDNGIEEVKQAENHSIRLLTVPKVVSLSPLNDFEGEGWVECNPSTARDFSAIGYYYGKYLHEELDVPVGLINTSWGGTRVEPWTSGTSCETNDIIKDWYSQIKSIDIEAIKKREEEKIIKYNEALEIAKGKPGTPHPYVKQEFNDGNWNEIKLPGLWEDSEIGIFDGIVWFRKSFILPESFNFSDAILYTGKIDDTDITWLNESVVGETYMQYNMLREYKVPAGILKPGVNTIVIRVEDYIGGGGIYGKDSELLLTDGKNEITLTGNWKYQKEELELPRNPRSPLSNVVGPNDYPAILFNGMINPLIPFGIKGAIWYQGESNAGSKKESMQYAELFPLMINDWRKHWNQGDFPFFFVQLANYMEPANEPKDEPWAYLRESQSLTASSVSKTGMACIIDIGDAKDIHPRNKIDVGKRLALSALKIAYSRDIVHSGPVYSSALFSGDKVVINFDNVGSGLIVKNKYGYINGFAVAGKDKKFFYAKAEISGKNTVTVYSPDVKEIVAVRYAWANNPDDVNLYNKEGLPAVPFRTDEW
ncbi:MAG: 9-O-acetylesterase [Bacteroidales bacterium]|nr:9-O-acetylesterase [Bacteroidales bacterium]